MRKINWNIFPSLNLIGLLYSIDSWQVMARNIFLFWRNHMQPYEYKTNYLASKNLKTCLYA